MTQANPSREEIGEEYFASLPYPPYPVQEQALLAWFLSEQGVLVSAPTGMGKTLVAHGAMFEALRLGKTAYYTTPLIALTEQKFQELQEAAVLWGYSADDVGLVTGNRRVNPDAKLLVVVAEILLNRLLHPTTIGMDETTAVVMDEFHTFSDPERGIVWELTLGLLPSHVRLMLLSATVGNAAEFVVWLDRSHGRKLEIVLGTDRKVPLRYHWEAGKLLGELVVDMAKGEESVRKTPALVFCFNRQECWNVGEQLKGLDLLSPEQRGPLHERLESQDWSTGIGAKLRQMLWRGVGVHHAGLMPKYRQIVEQLFLAKLLPVVLCTETLAAGLNLPARSVVLTELLKGPHGKKRLINSSIAHQIFGRAGRPQFDTEGFVIAVAHEDDVKIAKWEKKLGDYPENPKDPAMIKAKKAYLKKKPTRRSNEQYWTEAQFQKLIQAPPSHLASYGPMPWRLLAYLLKASPEIERIRRFLHKRLLDPGRVRRQEKDLIEMLLVLHHRGFVRLEPAPPPEEQVASTSSGLPSPNESKPSPVDGGGGLFSRAGFSPSLSSGKDSPIASPTEVTSDYQPESAFALASLDRLLAFRGIHPLYGSFLLSALGRANEAELIQAMESALPLPRGLLRTVRPPLREEMPPGPMERDLLDPQLVERRLMLVHFVDPSRDEDDEEEGEDNEPPPTLADKLRMLFDDTHRGVEDVETQSIWAAGEILRYGGDFDKFVRTQKLAKEEGILFRHVLRLILVCGEFAAQSPENTDIEEWRATLADIARRLTASCRKIDPKSTARTLQQARADDFTASSHGSPSVGSDNAWDKQWDQILNELQ